MGREYGSSVIAVQLLQLYQDQTQKAIGEADSTTALLREAVQFDHWPCQRVNAFMGCVIVVPLGYFIDAKKRIFNPSVAVYFSSESSSCAHPNPCGQ